MTNDLQNEAARLQSEITERTKKIQIGCSIFNSKIEGLTIIVKGHDYAGDPFNCILDFRLHQEKPAEFSKFVNDFTTRLIAERTILQTQLADVLEQLQNIENPQYKEHFSNLK